MTKQKSSYKLGPTYFIELLPGFGLGFQKAGDERFQLGVTLQVEDYACDNPQCDFEKHRCVIIHAHLGWVSFKFVAEISY